MCRPAYSRIALKDRQLYFFRTLPSSTALIVIDSVSMHTLALQRPNISGTHFHLLWSPMLLYGIPYNKHNLQFILSDFLVFFVMVA